MALSAGAPGSAFAGWFEIFLYRPERLREFQPWPRCQHYRPGCEGELDGRCCRGLLPVTVRRHADSRRYPGRHPAHRLRLP